MIERQKNIFRFALAGAFGFGIGGLFYDNSFGVLGFLTQALIGGLALGIAYKLDAGRVFVTGISSAAGFLIGAMMLLPVIMIFIGDRFNGEPPVSLILSALYGGFSGAVGGAAIAIGLGEKRLIKTLVVGGGLGFALAMVATTGFHYGLDPQHGLSNILSGVFGGGAMGAALGQAKRIAQVKIG
ncbi:MAG: hypothetical protein TUN42_00400 [Dehalogenimonas sp.]